MNETALPRARRAGSRVGAVVSTQSQACSRGGRQEAASTPTWCPQLLSREWAGRVGVALLALSTPRLGAHPEPLLVALPFWGLALPGRAAGGLVPPRGMCREGSCTRPVSALECLRRKCIMCFCLLPTELLPGAGRPG